MKTLHKYLLGYGFLLLIAKFWLSSLHPLVSFSIIGAVFIIIIGYEGNRFIRYIKQYQKEVYYVYKKKTITGNVWLRKFTRENSRKSKTDDMLLLYNCRRALYVSYLSFPALLLLIVVSLPK